MTFPAFEDMSQDCDLLPVFGLRILVGLDSDGKTKLVVDREGEIESSTLIGVLEVIQSRLFREFTS